MMFLVILLLVTNQALGQLFNPLEPQAGFGPGYGGAFHQRFNIPPPENYGGVRLPDLPPNGWVFTGDPNIGLARQAYTPIPTPTPHPYRMFSSGGQPIRCHNGRQVSLTEWECFNP